MRLSSTHRVLDRTLLRTLVMVFLPEHEKDIEYCHKQKKASVKKMNLINKDTYGLEATNIHIGGLWAYKSAKVG